MPIEERIRNTVWVNGLLFYFELSIFFEGQREEGDKQDFCQLSLPKWLQWLELCWSKVRSLKLPCLSHGYRDPRNWTIFCFPRGTIRELYWQWNSRVLNCFTCGITALQKEAYSAPQAVSTDFYFAKAMVLNSALWKNLYFYYPIWPRLSWVE